MADGRVITGFSKPYYAAYSNSGTTVSYSGAAIMARGVSVSLSPESADDNNFYADNVVAESVSGVFTGGTATLTVDGPLQNAIKDMRGLPALTNDWMADGDEANPPYLGIGYIVRYMSGGATKYVPTVLAKCRLSIPEESAATQADEIDWQTTELVFTLMRDDSEHHNWRHIGKEYESEAAAESALVTKLGGAAATT